MTSLVFERVTEEANNLAEFKHLLVCLFPVVYPRAFFKEILLGRIEAFVVRKSDGDGAAIGCLSWRKVASDGGIELLHLGVKVLDRRRGHGSAMLRFLDECTGTARPIVLHVSVSNEEAVQFYRARGFRVDDTVPGYYRRLEPSPDAYLMSLPIKIVTPDCE